MKVILKESLDHLGEIGDVISVKDGYARNYLLPLGKASIATAQELKRLDELRGRLSKAKEQALVEAKALGDKLGKSALMLTAQVSEEGQMFGSIGVADIVKALEKQGFSIEKRQVLLPEPIRALGVHAIPVRVHHDVTVTVSTTIVREETKPA